MNKQTGIILAIILGFSQINLISATSCLKNSESANDAQAAGSEQVTWEERRHFLPENMRSTGQASGYLNAEQVIIEFNIETLSDSAGTSLVQNNQSISKAVAEMKKHGIEDKELSTQGLTIFPSNRSEYDENTKSYKNIFEGYKVQNKLRFVSKKIELAGKIIDIAIQNGINQVESVQFVPTSQKIKELKDSLISKAVEDAINRATLALSPLNYEIKSVKSVDLDNRSFGGSNSYMKASSFRGYSSDSEDTFSDSTQLFSSHNKYNVSVDVTFIIGKKETQSASS